MLNYNEEHFDEPVISCQPSYHVRVEIEAVTKNQINSTNSRQHEQQLRTNRIPFTRAASVLNFTAFLNRIGAPTERYLHQARIPLSLLDDPENPVPLHLCYRFCEIVVRKEKIEDLGLLVAQNTSLNNLGSYGQILAQSLTVFDYLNTGIYLFNQFTSGEQFWLEEHDNNLRLYHSVPEGSITASAQAQLFALMTTINTLRSVVGNDWYPEELQLSEISGHHLSKLEDLAETRIMNATGPAYFSLPRVMLEHPFKPVNETQTFSRQAVMKDQSGHPDNFTDSLTSLVEILLQTGYPDIDLAAEAAGLSRRTFQRYLANLGLSYSQVIDNTRMRLACRWLEATDMPVMDIALALGYTDASNFTRAFRRRTGIPPQLFRAKTRKD